MNNNAQEARDKRHQIRRGEAVIVSNGLYYLRSRGAIEVDYGRTHTRLIIGNPDARIRLIDSPWTITYTTLADWFDIHRSMIGKMINRFPADPHPPVTKGKRQRWPGGLVNIAESDITAWCEWVARHIDVRNLPPGQHWIPYDWDHDGLWDTTTKEWVRSRDLGNLKLRKVPERRESRWAVHP